MTACPSAIAALIPERSASQPAGSDMRAAPV